MSRIVRTLPHRVARALQAPLRRLGARADGSDRGAVLPIVALFMTVLVVAMALTFDIGRLTVRNRDLQQVADLVSLDATRAIKTNTTASLVSNGSEFLATVAASAANNGFPVTCVNSQSEPTYEAICSPTQSGSDDELYVDVGFWCTTSGAATSDTSDPCYGVSVPSGKPGVLLYDISGTNIPDAVQVRAGDKVKFYFGVGFVQSTSRSGTANIGASADFGLGTSFLNLDTNQSKLFEPLLNGLFGIDFNTQIVGWNGLASAGLSISSLGTALGLNLGSATSALGANITLLSFLTASAQVFDDKGDIATANLLRAISVALPSPIRSATFKLGDLLDISANDFNSALSSTVNILQLLTGVGEIINGSHNIDLSNLNFSVPGGLATVGGLTASLIDPVEFKYHAHVGDSVQAGQATMSMNVFDINANPLLGLINALSLGLTNLQAEIGPATISVGGAVGKATLTSVTCTPTPSMTLGVMSGLTSLTMNIPINITAKLLFGFIKIPIVTGSIVVTEDQDNQVKYVTYTFPPDTPGEAKDLGGGSLWNGTPNMSSSNLKILYLPVGWLLSSILSVIVVPILNAVNTLVLQPLQSLLGLSVGDATTFAGFDNPPARCDSPQLVQ